MSLFSKCLTVGVCTTDVNACRSGDAQNAYLIYRQQDQVICNKNAMLIVLLSNYILPTINFYMARNPMLFKTLSVFNIE